MIRPDYVLLFAISLFSIACTPQQKLNGDKSDKKIFCVEELSKAEEDSFKYNLVIATYQAITKNNSSIWDADFIASDKLTADALKEFHLSKRGILARHLKLAGKSADEIHNLLIGKKFSHMKVPLKVRGDDEKYWLKDGSTTQNINDPKLVLMDIYVHKDGSMVRVKPFGVPDLSGLIEPRRMPHVSKSVLKKLCQKAECTPDTSFVNEAFKITDEGFPVPKSSSRQGGLKLPYDGSTELGKMYNEVIMSTNAALSHINLGMDCRIEQLITK